MSFGSGGFEIVILPSTLLLTFFVGFFTCLIASIIPSYQASRKPIIECLNPIEEKSEREKKRYLKPILYSSLGVGLIAFGAISLILSSMDGMSSFGPPSSGSSQAMISMAMPVLIMLGVIMIAAVFVRPLSKVIIVFFRPYLRQTKLLTQKNILRHRKRTVLTFSMISLTVSFLIGMSVMMDSMSAGVDTIVTDFMGSDVRVFT